MQISAINHIEKLSYYFKDGFPTTFFDQVIAHNFIITDILVIIASVIMILYLKKEWNWKIFCVVCIPCIISGFIWGKEMLYADPNFPAWMILPTGSVGEIWLWSVEDCIFNVATTFLFYGVFRLVHIKKVNDFKCKFYIKFTYMLFLFFSSLFMIKYGAYCGKSLTYLYAIPSIFLMIYVWDKINSKLMSLFLFVMILFEVLWDWFAVSWLYYFKSWAPGWIYLSYNDNNILYCSNVFLDPVSYPWAWIFNNPIEITPWYGIVGATFVYMAILAADKILKNRE